MKRKPIFRARDYTQVTNPQERAHATYRFVAALKLLPTPDRGRVSAENVMRVLQDPDTLARLRGYAEERAEEIYKNLHADPYFRSKQSKKDAPRNLRQRAYYMIVMYIQQTRKARSELIALRPYLRTLYKTYALVEAAIAYDLALAEIEDLL